MKLWARIFLGYLMVVGLAAWFVLRVFSGEVKPGVRQAVEDVMVDSANLLAELAADDLGKGRLPGGDFARALAAYQGRAVRATIWGIEKQSLDLRVYVTDAHGVVVFDSAGLATGQDYSRWNDVRRTLDGKYGARATRSDPADERTSTLFVAAPVRADGRLLGVVSVSKPVAALQPIIDRSEAAVLRSGALLLLATFLVGAGFTFWFTHSMRGLVHYGRALAQGTPAEPPSRGRDEIGELARALASLRQEVDGRAYVERYVEHLTHEMKSPLTAIRGATEVLAEPLAEGDRRHFSRSAIDQVERLRVLVDRLLRLAQLDHLEKVELVEEVPLQELFDELERNFGTLARGRELSLSFGGRLEAPLRVDRFLVTQALSALLENAIDFSGPGGSVECEARSEGGMSVFEVRDRGTGIPEFALSRVFERFFSLPRPDGGPRSSGLGLSLAQEIASLHGGSVTLQPREGGGVVATVRLGTPR